MITLGNRLKNARKQNGLSIVAVKKLLENFNENICASIIYKWESNEVTPPISILNYLANIYNTTVSQLIDDTMGIQALNEFELKFIDTLRIDPEFKKIIYMIIKKDKKELRHGNKIIC